jgi:thiol-disulfide isomerase/thioredoxin
MIIKMRTFLRGFLLIIICSYSEYESFAQVKSVTISEVQQYIKTSKAPVLVLNFWATFCGPCVKEMPSFSAFAQKEKDVKLIFISLDLPEAKAKIPFFIQNNRISDEVWYLNETNANAYLSKIDADWDGALLCLSIPKLKKDTLCKRF